MVYALIADVFSNCCLHVCILRSKWAEILKLVQCEIVSVISGSEIDAYMLR